MRPKFVFALFLFAFLVLGAALTLKQYLGHNLTPVFQHQEVKAAPSPAAKVAMNVPSPSTPASSTPAPASPAPAVVPVSAPIITNALTPEQRRAAIDAEMDRLQEWSANHAPASLSNILADLTYPDKEVREAAIEAARQFGSPNAIPALKAAAESTDDLQEKMAYLEAADFLSLPPMNFLDPNSIPPPSQEQIQMARQRAAAGEAGRQPQKPKQHFKQSPQTSFSQN